MAYLNKVIKTKIKPCSCSELPSIIIEDLDVGTTWKCDTCEKVWKVLFDANSFPLEELVWKDVSGKQNRS